MVKPLWFCFSSFSSQLYLSYCLESLAGDFQFQQLLPGGRSWTGGLSFGHANPSSKQEQGLLSQLQLQLQHCVRRASQLLKTMKKRKRHLLCHQGTHTSPPTGCLHHHHLFAIGKKAFLSLTPTPRYHVPTSRLSSTPYSPLKDSFSSTTIETVTSTDSYDTVASDVVDARWTERGSDVISVVHLQGPEEKAIVTSI